MIRIKDMISENHLSFLKIQRQITEITEIVKKVWRMLIPRTPHFIDRIDLVAECMTAQMTPLVTNRGVAIRLDLGYNIIYFDEECWDKQRSEYLYSLIMHEIWHFADRLNTEFAINYHEESLCGYLKYRKMVNAAWDVYIERRKLKKYKIPPYSWYKDQEKSYKDAAIDAVLSHSAVSKHYDYANSYFQEIWDTNENYSWNHFFEFAKNHPEST